MIFCFAHPDGTIHERVYPIGKAPAEIIIGGVPCPRDYGSENKVFADAAAGFAGKYPYVSRRLPKNLAGCETDKRGHSVVMSKRHEADIMSRHGYSRE